MKKMLTAIYTKM